MHVRESILEEATLAWMESTGWQVSHGFSTISGEPTAERSDFGEVILEGCLRTALLRLNLDLDEIAINETVRKLRHPSHLSFLRNNHAFHHFLVNGVPLDIVREDGGRGVTVKVIDFENPNNNDWLAINQFAVIENKNNRRPDIVAFVNGLPLAVIELKNPADEKATIRKAFNQLQTYLKEIPSLFHTNALMVVSDGLEARVGTVSSEWERFMPWRTVDGKTLAPPTVPQLEVVLRGIFDKRRFLDLIRHFLVFEEEGGGNLVKKMAGYHQFHAVRTAVEETLRATKKKEAFLASEPEGFYGSGVRSGGSPGDRRIGVVWHTQGSGKSLTMAFYAGKIILQPELENPTIVLLTDRNDLDDQLFQTFSRCQEILRQKPVQAENRHHLQDLLQVASGGVVFTTIQKFLPEEKGDIYPMLSDRRNIVVIADEAHRSQYDFIDGFAHHLRDALPNASFIGFTGTPLELQDKNTRAVFGDYISVYDIQRAVEDGATVPIYYESRLAKLSLLESERPRIDPGFEEVTEGDEVEAKEKLKSKWAALEVLVGTDKRIRSIARDLVTHWDERSGTLDGKAMIVCMSRRICVDLYNAIIALKPEWHSDEDTQGALKVVMTGSASDPLDWQPHIRNKVRRSALADRFKDPSTLFKIVIVRDMWLTGFDAPCLHTLYVDKPMRGHGLMQAIARVNRVFKDKPGGLVVDYLGLADQLRQAVAVYTESGGEGQVAVDQKEAVALLKEKYEICRDLFHGFDRSSWKSSDPRIRLSLIPAAQEHILKQENGKSRFVQAVTDLSKAFALAVPDEEALRLREDVAFFQAVRAALIKGDPSNGTKDKEKEHAIRQIISRSIASEGIVDIFSAAGLKKPDISLLSDEFLEEVRHMPQKNLAIEVLRKLLNNEITIRSKRHLVQSRSFAEMLEQSIRKYQNRAIETVQVIEELIQLAKEMKEADRRGERLGLSDDEIAFYEALEVNDSAVRVLGDETLMMIARDLLKTVRQNTTIDWTVKESLRANMRRLVKRILRKYGYPPDKQEKATQTVLEQAELLSGEWTQEFSPRPS